MEGSINIQNEDNECLRRRSVRYLNPVNKNPAKIKNVDEKYARQFVFKDVKFLIHKKGSAKTKKTK